MTFSKVADGATVTEAEDNANWNQNMKMNIINLINFEKSTEVSGYTYNVPTEWVFDIYASGAKMDSDTGFEQISSGEHNYYLAESGYTYILRRKGAHIS